ncbi:MAG: type III-A CRISPR-associated protein Csm2 [bacterium]
MIKFYDEKGKVHPDLYDQKAQEVAQKLIEGKFNKKYNKTNYHGVSRSQLRKLFDEVKSIEKKLNNNSWEDVLPLVKMIKSKAAYNTSRMIKNEKANKKYYEFLNEFVKNGIDQVYEYRDYKTFCMFFEAVYGFYYENGGYATK